ncbi:redox-regulated ATPase YchF [Candidatus Pacearchaeota archaeon]|nr:redox-regulated ATPase YchF [Candidatus Pacearchaeota archaeon]MBD3282990.1 redox-regulated ATPase YchF [Candidatus Pacearchaeota archaeon]
MLIGIVGKPSCGKSTFFKAATLADVLIANYPFATIKPNHAIGYVKIDCIEEEFEVKCNPQKGYCKKSKRFVPVDLFDVAGLIEGSSEGKGLGNQFLDDLAGADALIHIIDVSGETDSEGKETKGYNPIEDVKMLERELDLWYLGILKKVWRTFSRTIQNTKQDFAKAVAKQFSGLKVGEDDIRKVVLKLKYESEKPNEWSDEQLFAFAHELRCVSKPMIIAANKIDKENSRINFDNLKNAYPELIIVPCSAEAELALREADKHGLVDYIPGESDFEIKGELNEKQKNALEKIKLLLREYKSSGVQEVLNKVVFDLLKYIAVFPAGANKLTDSKGNVLPDCFLLPEGSTALDFAYTIHTDLGKNFIKAIDARTKQAVGKEYKVKHRDALEIVTR